jgi:hypothetical protein
MRNFLKAHRLPALVMTGVLIGAVFGAGIAYAATTWIPTTINPVGTFTVNPAPVQAPAPPTPVFNYTVNGVTAPGPVTLDFGNTSQVAGAGGTIPAASVTVVNSASSTATITTLTMTFTGTMIKNRWLVIWSGSNAGHQAVSVSIPPGGTWIGTIQVEDIPSQQGTPVGTYNLNTFQIILTPS